MKNNKITELSNEELKSIFGGHPVAVIYAAAATVYATVLATIRSKGYNDGKKSSHCN